MFYLTAFIQYIMMIIENNNKHASGISKDIKKQYKATIQRNNTKQQYKATI